MDSGLRQILLTARKNTLRSVSKTTFGSKATALYSDDEHKNRHSAVFRLGPSSLLWRGKEVVQHDHEIIHISRGVDLLRSHPLRDGFDTLSSQKKSLRMPQN
jgi:hypothetical protein